MIKTIIKRDGRIADFNIDKIANAVFMAAKANGGSDYDEAMSIALAVVDYIENKEHIETPHVEHVQDVVEKMLIETGHARTAKSYILYRANRNKVREMNTRLMKTMENLTFQSAKENDVKRENANINGDTAMGTMLKYGSEAAKQFYEMYILNPRHAQAHHDGDIHIHDLDFLTLTTTCCQIDILKLFKGGFDTGHGHLREPQDIASYAALACIAIQSNQNDQHGGQSIPNFDYGMAPGVAKSYKKIYCQNLGRALELLANEECGDCVAEEILNEAINLCGEWPKLEDGEVYKAAELSLLKEKYGEEIAVKAQEFAFRRAEKEIDRATFQAMEALVHNLNTMHSRAGAQVPFSSINYGTDTSPEGRLVIKNILLATEAG
ncbi:MAG: anaerobic ribonucleoside triphosphate reductase, partial [Oscillospiraceae bacterium]|nr:anaerobic ribonucleoside triphosphate reductase [Oscillospiraceae bacterium]